MIGAAMVEIGRNLHILKSVVVPLECLQLTIPPQYGECVDDVCAQRDVHVSWEKVAALKPILRPVRVVTHPEGFVSVACRDSIYDTSG